MTTIHVPAAKLAKLSTADLIAQYDLAVATPKRAWNANGQATRAQIRIDRIVDMLVERAEADDTAADAWLRAS